MGRRDGFNSAVILSAYEDFTHPPELALHGLLGVIRITLLGGRLRHESDDSTHRGAPGVMVLRSRIGSADVYTDRVPVRATLRAGADRRAMWLSGHGDRLPAGILTVASGDTEFCQYAPQLPPEQRHVPFMPLEIPKELPPHGLSHAPYNHPAVCA